MNSRTTLTFEALVRLSQSIALELSALSSTLNWSAECSENFNDRTTLRRTDGLTLTLIPGYDWANKISIQHVRPRGDQKNGQGGYVDLYENGGRIATPIINVGETKTAAKIAQDITRRLLPAALRIDELALNSIAKDAKCNAGTKALRYELSALMNQECNEEQQDNHVHFGGAKIGYGTFRIDGPDSVKVELHTDKGHALKVAAFLKTLGY